MNTTGPIKIPAFPRLASRPLWARSALRIIQGRVTARQKEHDLFGLRYACIEDPRLIPTIVQVFKALKSDNNLGLLAKSLLVELGAQVEEAEIPEPLLGRKIYYAVRLLILSGRMGEAQDLLNNNNPESKYRITQILTRDPNEEIRRTVCAW